MRPTQDDSRRGQLPANPLGQDGRAWFRFLAGCALYWTLALLAVSAIPAIERASIRLTLGSAATLLGMIGQRVLVEGDVIAAGTARVRIVAECAPHLPLLLYFGVVLAYPAGWRLRAFGLGLGALLISLFNTVRVVALLGVMVVWPRGFEFAHVYLWQAGTLIVVFATVAIWLRVATGRLPGSRTG